MYIYRVPNVAYLPLVTKKSSSAGSRSARLCLKLKPTKDPQRSFLFGVLGS